VENIFVKYDGWNVDSKQAVPYEACWIVMKDFPYQVSLAFIGEISNGYWYNLTERDPQTNNVKEHKLSEVLAWQPTCLPWRQVQKYLCD